MSDDKKERKTPVYCRVNCYLKGPAGSTIKVKKDMAVLMTESEIKHFGKAVTKDVPDDAEEFKRVFE